MIGTKTKWMNWENILDFLSFECLFKCGLSPFILSIRKQEDGSDFIGMFSLFDGFDCKIKAWANVGSSSWGETIDMLSERDHVLRSDTFESTNSFTPTFESNDWESVSWWKCFKKVFHGAFNKFNFLTHHWTTDINYTNEVHTGSGSSLCS